MVYLDGQKKIYIAIILIWLVWDIILSIIVNNFEISDSFHVNLVGFGLVFGLFGTLLALLISAIVLAVINRHYYKSPDPNDRSDFSKEAKLNRRRDLHLAGAIGTTILDVIFLNFLMLFVIILIHSVLDINRIGPEIIMVIIYFVFVLSILYTLSCRSQVEWDKLGDFGWVYFKDNKLYLRKREIQQYFLFPVFKLDPIISSGKTKKEPWNIPVDDVDSVIWSTNYDWDQMKVYIIYDRKPVESDTEKSGNVVVISQDRIRDEDEFKRYFRDKLQEKFIDKHTEPEILDHKKYYCERDY